MRKLVAAASFASILLITGALSQNIISYWGGTNSFGGPIAVNVRTITGSGATTVTVSAAADYFICVNKTSGTTAVQLPAPPAVLTGFTGITFLVKDCSGIAATTGAITITALGTGPPTIDGASTFVMNTAHQSVAVTFNGANWFVN